MHHNSKENHLWHFIANSLSTELRCVLLMVVAHQGSSPGRGGFKMVINSQGTFGSIGGGVMEHKLVELSKKWLAEKRDTVELKHQVHRAEAVSDRSGMICSGEQYVAMVSLSVSSSELVTSIVAALEVSGSKQLELSPKGFRLGSATGNSGFTYQNLQEWKYTEQLNHQFTLHIIGGGHISLALSKLSSELGFRVLVYDHRENLNTIEENTFAHEIRVVNYGDLSGLVPSGGTEFVIIMTVGYRTDLEALKNIIQGRYRYLGLLGSKAKIEQMFQELEKEGYELDLLAGIDAPAGMEIGSQTPEEIAVSISAKLIQIRQEGQK